MATVLHLTDLHLEAPEDYGGASFKLEAIPPAHRPSRTKLICDTLEALAGSPRCPQLDCLIVTGDIPWQNHEAGWEKFEDVLKPLREAGKLPTNDHIVIVPGNHDVQWKLSVGDPGHYAHFRSYVRDRGYVTPLLDEQDDFNADGAITTDLSGHYLFDGDLGLLVIPINSSHYCGIYEPLRTLTDDQFTELVNGLSTEDAARVRTELDWHRLHDIPRISDAQMKAVRNLLAHVRAEVAKSDVDDADLVSIAAAHHHTLPVGTAEEVKTFESITNLGEFRQFLADSGFDLLIHGHKHASGLYWDRIHRPGTPLAHPDKNLLVISGSTLGSYQQGQEELARILAIRPGRRARVIDVSKVPAAPGAGPLPDPLARDQALLWRAEMTAPTESQLVSGGSVNDVYQRLQALFSTVPVGGEVHHLVCEVRSANDAQHLPDGYPTDVPGESHEEQLKWFVAMIEWWQRKDSRLLDFLHFTHGQRIRRHGVGEIDQLDEAIQVLQNDPDSSRAVISLIDPQVDALATDRKFPSFSLAHLSIRRSPAGVAYVDCVGVFRKQDMRYWWPINVAELQRLQDAVLRRLSRTDLRPGVILTYAVVAHSRSDVPEVNVTAVDRIADDDQTRLWSMAYLLAHPEDPNASEVRKDWHEILEDLEPGEESAPRPVLGLKLLRESLEWLSGNTANPAPKQALGHLADLDNAYQALDKKAGDPRHWGTQIENALSALRRVVEATRTSGDEGTIEADNEEPA